MKNDTITRVSRHRYHRDPSGCCIQRTGLLGKPLQKNTKMKNKVYLGSGFFGRQKSPKITRKECADGFSSDREGRVSSYMVSKTLALETTKKHLTLKLRDAVPRCLDVFGGWVFVFF